MQSPTSRSKPRVVVVEDDRTSRQLITKILEQAGYDVLECAEGRDALHIVSMNPPRAMIIDVMLPDMKGTKIAEEMSRDSKYRFTQCIFLTGILASKEQKKNYFFEIEGTRYRALPKPIRKTQLLQHLADAVVSSIEAEETEKREKLAEAQARAKPAEKEEAAEPDFNDEEIILCPGLY